MVAGRSDPPLPLARLRARGQLAELRAADLRFTLGETAQLMAAATGHDLPADLAVTLGERTDGWVAGLQLAALSLRGRHDVAGFVAEFSGSHRYVLDYLTEEVLERQPEDIRTFLLETSVLRGLSGPLCDAVLGRSDSQLLLESIERANLFLVPLDGERRWWRYHPLFADLLRSRLAHDDPARAAALHRAAADWYEHHQLPDDALGHALAGGDDDRAGRIVETHLEGQLLRRNEGATLDRWLTALPREVFRTRPRLVLGRAIVDLGAIRRAQGRLGAALRTYRTLEARADTAASALAGMSQVGAAMVLYERDELTEAATQAAAGVERCRRLAYGPPLVAGLITLAKIRLAAGDRAGALAAIAEAETAMPEIGDRRVPLGRGGPNSRSRWATSPRPPTGSATAASRSTTSRSTRGMAPTPCSPGC